MLYGVVGELIPEMSQGRHFNVCTVFFAVGFSIMMALDVALVGSLSPVRGRILGAFMEIREFGNLDEIRKPKKEGKSCCCTEIGCADGSL